MHNLSLILSRSSTGIDAPLITVETHLGNGLPAFSIVGLPEKAVQESRERVRAAIVNANFEFPARRITVNLAPADLPKEGSRFDLPIAIGILAASGQIQRKALQDHEFIGELALSGELRPVKGILPAALATARARHSLTLPVSNATESACVDGLRILAFTTLLQLSEHFNGTQPALPWRPGPESITQPAPLPDMRDVIGQQQAKRALLIAAAGGHSLLMSGPPGTGKSMLASRLPGLLPQLGEQEALESAAVRSVAGLEFNIAEWRRPPWRAPHHSASPAALVGGGTIPAPGEVSLSHHGVLFLDELPEFKRNVLEVLRQPLEDREVTIARTKFTITYPSSFMLVASMNPSPSGYFSPENHGFSNSRNEMQRYLSRISGPLLDRIDIHMEVNPVPFEQIASTRKGESSLEIRNRVVEARQIQLRRFEGQLRTHCNAQMDTRLIRNHCRLTKASLKLLRSAMEKLELSARAYDRILKVARTGADLAGSAEIKIEHLAEAIQYRSLDREDWVG